MKDGREAVFRPFGLAYVDLYRFASLDSDCNLLVNDIECIPAVADEICCGCFANEDATLCIAGCVTSMDSDPLAVRHIA